MLNQSYRHVFVANSPVLLASGTTVDLAVGQIGFFDGSTYAATTAPTYATNKAIQIWQGMPDLNHPSMMGIPLTNRSSKLIKGKLLTKFRRKTSSLGQNMKIAIGFDGFDTTKSLTAKCGEVKVVTLKLTGNPIDKAYNAAPGQGLQRQYWISAGNCDDCAGEDCSNVDPSVLADQLVSKINNDPALKLNNVAGGSIVKAKKVLSSAMSTSGATSYTEYTLTVADTGDASALAFVQGQYPTISISRIGREGIFSTYKMIKTTASGAPASFTNAGIFVLPECAACPTGYTLHASGYLYKLKRADAGDGTALTAVSTAYSIAATGESTVRVAYDATNAVSTYLIVSNTANQAAIGATDTITNYGSVANRCVLTTAVTTAWTVLSPVKWGFPKVFRITLQDTVCGTNRLAELQAAYPTLTVTQLADGPVACVHGYETTILSEPAGLDCVIDQIVYPALPAFQGTEWVVYSTASAFTGQAGVIIETAAVNRVTNELTYGYYPYEADTLFIEASEGSADYNESLDVKRWAITELQSVKYAQGVGARVRDEEIKSFGYFLKEYAFDPAVREAEGFVYFADPNAMYDEYTLHYDFQYKVLGWSQTYTDSYQQVIYVKSGSPLGKALETAVLTYTDSIGHSVDIDLK